MALGIFLTILIIVIDQLLKLSIISYIKDLGSKTLIPGLINITYVENRGAAFGLMQGCKIFFVIVSVLMIFAFIYLIAFKRLRDKIFLSSAILIIGGGISNFLDRVFLGYVIDYIELSFFPPVCNFADYCITIGAVLLSIYFLFYTSKDGKLKGFLKEEENEQRNRNNS